MDSWLDTCGPSIDPDSPLPYHRGSYSIPPFQTHSRYFYAPLGEACCGRQFVDLYYQQHHPYPHCPDCARMVLRAASHLCWQCRTYFRRYGTGMMQQIMGVTPQRHSILEVRVPERGLQQRRLPEEERAQEWRDDSLSLLQPPILQILLPRASTCLFWQNVSAFLNTQGNHRHLFSLPTVPMPYFSEKALLPLPPTPADGFRTGLSLSQEVIEAAISDDEDITTPPPSE